RQAHQGSRHPQGERRRRPWLHPGEHRPADRSADPRRGIYQLQAESADQAAAGGVAQARANEQGSQRRKWRAAVTKPFSKAEIKAIVRDSYKRTLGAPVPHAYEPWLTLAHAIAHISRASDSELRAFAAECKRVGYDGPAGEDAAKALAKLERWRELLK